MNREESRYVRNSLVTLIARFGVLILLVGINAIIGRTIGPPGKGLVSLISMVAGFLAALATFGFEYANVYFLGKDRSLTGPIITQNLFLLFGVTLIVVPALIYAGKWLSPLILKAIPSVYWTYALIAVPFMIVVRLSLTLFQGLEDFTHFNSLEVIRFLGYLVLAFLILVLLKRGMRGGVELVLSQAIAGSIFGFLLILHRRLAPRRMNLSLLKSSFSLGIRAHIGQVLQFFNYRLDLFLVNFYLGVSAVGLYAASVGIGELLWHLPSALSLTLFPRAAGLPEDESAFFSAKVLRTSTALIFIGAIAIVFLGGILLELIYGRPFRRAYPALILLIPGIVSFSVAKISIGFLHGRGKPLYGTLLTLFSLFFTVILDILLIPRWGIEGAAAASSLVYSLGGILSLHWFKKESGLGYKELLILKVGDLELLSRQARKLWGRLF